MAETVYKGTVRGRTVVFDDDVDLPDGTGVLVTPGASVEGSPQGVLAAAKAEPHVTQEDVAELLRLIDQGTQPVRYDNPLAPGAQSSER